MYQALIVLEDAVKRCMAEPLAIISLASSA
jgi:hypothetical protein